MVNLQADRRSALLCPWRIVLWGSALLALLSPLVAMQFSGEVNWSGGDFAAAALLFGMAGGAVELAICSRRKPAYRAGACLAVFAALLLVAANLAVGIAGSESDPANGWFMAVPLVGIVGAVRARLRAQGMMITMLAMAAMQMVAAVMAGWTIDVIAATVGFGTCWLVAAGLFRRAT